MKNGIAGIVIACGSLTIPGAALAQEVVVEERSTPVLRRTAPAGFTSQADLDAQAAVESAQARARAEAYYNEPLGKTYWYKPSKSTIAVEFFQHVDAISPGWRKLESRIFPQSTMSFKVVERISLNTPRDFGAASYAYRVAFENGTPAYIAASHLGVSSPDAPVKSHGYSPTAEGAAAVDEQNRRLFTENPDLLAQRHLVEQAEKARIAAELSAAEAQRKAAEAAARTAAEAALQAADKARRAAAAREYKQRGGVRLGMTPAQVRASQWGAPQKVNRTTNGFGVSEQWVYGDGNYLYFRNGLLATIQN